MNRKEQFIEGYKKALDSEFDLFSAQASQHHFEASGKVSPTEEKRLQESVNKEQARLNEIKADLKGIQLTPKEAIEVIQTKQEGQFFGLDDINGADCYRFMNLETKQNKQVALEAYKADPNTQKHFPPSIKERVEGKNVEQVLGQMAALEKLQEQMKPKKAHSQSMSMSM